MPDSTRRSRGPNARRAHARWAVSFWTTWGVLALLLGAILTAALWLAAGSCAPWFALGYLLALLVLAILCLWSWNPPPPPISKRFRLINCDGKQNLKRLRLKLKRHPEDLDWLQRPWQEYDVEVPHLQFIDFDPLPGELCFGVYAAVDYEYAHGAGSPMSGTTRMDSHFQGGVPIEEATLHFHDQKLEFLPHMILEECP